MSKNLKAVGSGDIKYQRAPAIRRGFLGEAVERLWLEPAAFPFLFVFSVASPPFHFQGTEMP
jgi:hypothetical protein